MHRLARMRGERLWTQEELARRSGVCVRTVQMVEAGAACRVTTKRRLLGAFGVELAQWREVFGEEEGS